MEEKDNSKQRRTFLKGLFVAFAGIAFAITPKNTAQNKESKKIKMLNPAGKLVEIEESVYTQIASREQRASNKEVQEWMKTSST